MRYNVMAGGPTGVFALKRDTIEGAVKKAGELRQSGEYSDVRIIDTSTGAVVGEPHAVDGAQSAPH